MVLVAQLQQGLDVDEDVVHLDAQPEHAVRVERTALEQSTAERDHGDEVVGDDLLAAWVDGQHPPRQQGVVDEVTDGDAQHHSATATSGHTGHTRPVPPTLPRPGQRQQQQQTIVSEVTNTNKTFESFREWNFACRLRRRVSPGDLGPDRRKCELTDRGRANPTGWSARARRLCCAIASDHSAC